MTLAQTDRNTPTSSQDLSNFAAAQHDMRLAYLGGAPGVLVSGLVWAVAGCVATWISPERAVWALFIGGMFIHPVAVLLVRLFGGTGRHAPGNPLGLLATVTTIWMIMMLPLAYGVSLLRVELFFPAMLFVIGGRYLCFQMLYANRLYLVCGAVLALAGGVLVKLNAPVAMAAFAGALIELVFAALLLTSARRDAAKQAALS